MIRLLLACAMLVLTGLPLAAAAGRADATDPATVNAADAAPYLGDWTLALEGSNGPGTFAVSLKVESDTVVGDIGSETLPTQPFTSISSNAKGIAMHFAFPYEGMTVDAVVSLVPGGGEDGCRHRLCGRRLPDVGVGDQEGRQVAVFLADPVRAAWPAGVPACVDLGRVARIVASSNTRRQVAYPPPTAWYRSASAHPGVPQ